MNVQIEHTKYDNHEIIKLMFDYDKDIVAKIRTIPGARWSRSMKCWYVADQPQNNRLTKYWNQNRTKECI